MEDKNEISGILIGLDELLDTRLATLSDITDEQLELLLNGYTERSMDVFPGVSMEEFKERYSSRNKKTLADAGITGIAIMVNEFVTKTIKKNISSPWKMRPKVFINIHPYVLTEEEIKNIIRGLRAVVDKMADIEVINKSYDELTPSYLSANVSIMVMYEYGKWLDAQSLNGQFKHSSCPEVTLMGPKIYFSEPKDNVEGDAFAAIAELAEPYVNLKLIPIESFCYLGTLAAKKKQE